MTNSEVKNPLGEKSLVNSWSLDDRSRLAGVNTSGCSCGHHGMSPAWHGANCVWVLALNEGGGHA